MSTLSALPDNLDTGDMGLTFLANGMFRPTYEVRCEIYYVNFELPGTVAECSEDIEWTEKWTPPVDLVPPMDWPTPVEASAPPSFSLAMPKDKPYIETPKPYDPWDPAVVVCCSTTGTEKQPPVEVEAVPLPASVLMLIAALAMTLLKWRR